MNVPTFFGEVVEPASRALIHSDEEYSSDEDIAQSVTERRDNSVDFTLIDTPNLLSQCEVCVISCEPLNKKVPSPHATLIAHCCISSSKEPIGALCLIESAPSPVAWCILDSNNKLISDDRATVLAPELLKSLFKLISAVKTFSVISRQFTRESSPTYLVNSCSESLKLPGNRMIAPAMLTRQLEASIFETLTILSFPCVVFCLPDPKDSSYEIPEEFSTLLPSSIARLRFDDIMKARAYLYS